MKFSSTLSSFWNTRGKIMGKYVCIYKPMRFMFLTALNVEITVIWEVILFNIFMYMCANFSEESAAFLRQDTMKMDAAGSYINAGSSVPKYVASLARKS
jgi:hypothetical protein